MSLLFLLESVFLAPVKLVLEIIFSIAKQYLHSPALALAALAVGMNVLLFGLYRKADAAKAQMENVAQGAKNAVQKLKKLFAGEKKPFAPAEKKKNAWRDFVRVALEIPLLWGTCRFLYGLYILDGVSLGPVKNLYRPDGLLSLAGFSVNLLPVVWAAVLAVAGVLYLKEYGVKSKLIFVGAAVLLGAAFYDAPAGVIVYFLIAALFFLGRVLLDRMSNPQKVLAIGCAVMSLAVFYVGLFALSSFTMKRRILVLGIGVLLLLPLAMYLLKDKIKRSEKVRKPKPDRKLFLAGSVLLTVLIGVLIPSSVLAASPEEFIDVYYYHNPLLYLVRSCAVAAGFFLFWLQVVYRLAKKKGKVLLETVVLIACGTGLINFLFFGQDLGTISPYLRYDAGLVYSSTERLVNTAVFVLAAGGLYLLAKKAKWTALPLLLSITVAISGMAAVNMITIGNAAQEVHAVSLAQSESDKPHFRLSKTGKNVVVIMLDRAMGGYVPYILDEKPELKETFDGFTYYSNTITFGNNTNHATPALFGGYEYTPVELNKRDGESLEEKHNEALKMLPVLFSKEGYEVTVCDPPYAGYDMVPDLSIFDDHPEINTFLTSGRFTDDKQKQSMIDNNYRNFFCFGLVKALPITLQSVLYSGASYHQVCAASPDMEIFTQVATSKSTASGMSGPFLDAYNVLTSLPQMSHITEDNVNTYFTMDNETVHEPLLLQMPDYTPAYKVDNRKWNTHEYVVDGVALPMNNAEFAAQYHVTMSALLRLGEWFDFLRENGVYDNTKIIVVSDHGYVMDQFANLLHTDKDGDQINVERFFPLLLVKDFGATGFTTSAQFMTNADVPTLATQGAVENPVNPFTGKPVNNEEKTAHDQIVIISDEWDVGTNNGNTYLPDYWASVHDNIWQASNWDVFMEKTVLKEHKLPQ